MGVPLWSDERIEQEAGEMDGYESWAAHLLRVMRAEYEAKIAELKRQLSVEIDKTDDFVSQLFQAEEELERREVQIAKMEAAIRGLFAPFPSDDIDNPPSP